MTIADRLLAPTVRPVFAGWLDLLDDPVFGWTGPGSLALSGTGDPVLDNNIFVPVEGAVEIGDFTESMGAGRPLTITFSAPDNDAPVIRQIVRDRRIWQLRRAKIWLLFLMEDQASVHPEFTQLFSGVIVQATTNRQPDTPATIVLELDADLRGAAGAPARLLDHSRFNLADRFSDFILPLAQGPITGAAQRVSPFDRGGGARPRFPYDGFHNSR